MKRRNHHDYLRHHPHHRGCSGPHRGPHHCFRHPLHQRKTTANQQQQINAWVRIAVTAAEQIYTGSGRGAEKKEYVINWLREHGMTVDESKLDALIEAAVYDLNNGFLTIGGIAEPATNAEK